MTDDKLERAYSASKRIAQLQAEIAEREEEVENLKQFVANLVPTGETMLGDEERGYIKAVVIEGKMFNEAWGKKQRPDLWEKYAVAKFVLDSATAKKVLSEEEYAVFQKPNNKTTVKIEVQHD